MQRSVVCVWLCFLYLCVWPAVHAWHKHVRVIVSVFPCAGHLLARYFLPTAHQTHSAEPHTHTHKHTHMLTHRAGCSDVTELTPTDWNRDLCKHVIKSAHRFKNERAIQRHTSSHTHTNNSTYSDNQKKESRVWPHYWPHKHSYTRVKLCLGDCMSLIVLSFGSTGESCNCTNGTQIIKQELAECWWVIGWMGNVTYDSLLRTNNPARQTIPENDSEWDRGRQK